MTYELCTGIPAGGRVANGYPGGTCTAPDHGGPWTLVEVADDSNCHLTWRWIEGIVSNALCTYEELREV